MKKEWKKLLKKNKKKAMKLIVFQYIRSVIIKIINLIIFGFE